MMHIKTRAVVLILLMQAFGLLLAQTSAPIQPDSPGILPRLMGRARETKAKIETFGDTAFGLMGAYYEDYVQPVTDSYAEWASNIRSSLWEKLQTTIDNYMLL